MKSVGISSQLILKNEVDLYELGKKVESDKKFFIKEHFLVKTKLTVETEEKPDMIKRNLAVKIERYFFRSSFRASSFFSS